MPKNLVTHRNLYNRVELSEADYENLLRAWAPQLFPGYRWYPFKPAILSPEGVVHPDAALISADGDEWWVVEIELARHSIQSHVESQLQRLRNGIYATASRAYLTSSYPADVDLFDRMQYVRPHFLVVVDDRSTLIRNVAEENDFEVLYVLPFLSGTPAHLYAGAAEGFFPSRRARSRATGIVLEMRDDPFVVRLSSLETSTLPADTDQVLIGSRLVRCRIERNLQGLVLSLGPEEFYEILGRQSYYVLRFEQNQPACLNPLPTLGG
jgi:hypothetical protein